MFQSQENIDVLQIKEQIKRSFGKYPRKAPALVVFEPEPAQNTLREKTSYEVTNLSYLKLGFHSVSMYEKEMPALDILSKIIGEGKASILNNDIVKDKTKRT